MQLLPGTAHFIAKKSGGTSFQIKDLGTPQINIAYGSWYLRYLIDRYTATPRWRSLPTTRARHNVDKWVRRAGGARQLRRRP